MSQVTFDLVTEDPATGEWAIYLVEDGPWPKDDNQWSSVLRALQERVYSAVDVVLGGQFQTAYPAAQGRSARIQVDSPSGCPARVQELISALDVCVNENEMYASAISSGEFVASLRIVTGHELGRFRQPPTDGC